MRDYPEPTSETTSIDSPSPMQDGEVSKDQTALVIFEESDKHN